MKIYIDRQKLNARASLANFASVGGLVVLLASVVVPWFVPGALTLSLILLILGASTAMVGIYLANRWIRKPRPEESLDKALKAFDDHYRIYHYPALPCDHLLLTPAGVTAFEVVNLSGSFSYREGRWKEAMTIGRALRYMVEPRISDPLALARAQVEELGQRFKQELGPDVVVPIKALTVFTHPGVELEIEGPSFPACRIEKLRKQSTPGTARLAPETFDKLAAYLEKSTLG
jgi:hypothetical protein